MRKYYIFYGVLFLLIAFLTLNFNYVEGDDASTIIHHALNRDGALQPPYSAYHSMFDTVMSLVPSTNETVLRVTGISLSFIFGFIILCLFAKILNQKIIDKEAKYFLFLLPFIVPDILFSSLLINPTNIAIGFILGGHVLFIKYLNTKKKTTLLLSIILFGFGASFRWITGFYIFVFFAEYIIANKHQIKSLFKPKQLLEALIIFVGFTLSIIFFIYLSGYTIFEMIEVYKNGTSYVQNVEISLIAKAIWGIPLFTPACIVLVLSGMIYLLKERKFMPILFLLISFIPYAITTGFNTSYKLIITLMIPLLLICLYGYMFLVKRMRYIVLILVFLPWVMGVNVESNSSWGPGFEIKNKDEKNTDYQNFNPDKSAKLKKFSVVFGSGTAMPTPEGPRPLYGFASVFLKDWYTFIEAFNKERNDAVVTAEKSGSTILQDVNHSFISTKLLEKGYSTQDPFFNVKERKFIKEKDTVVIHVLSDKIQLFNAAKMNARLGEGEKPIVIFSSYSNIITKMKTLFPDRFSVRGAYWGVLSLH
jgi:hypothetical protein